MSKHGKLSDPEFQAKSRRIEKDGESLYEADLRKVLSEPWGRRFIHGLIDERCKVSAASFSPNGSQTFYAEGRRAIGIEIATDAQRVAPDLYVLAIAEALDARLSTSRLKVGAEAEETNDG